MVDPKIPATMKPWAGGDRAPADWDGGPVRFRTGRVAMPVMRQRVWEHPCPYPAASDIIAYTPAFSTPTTPDEGLSASDERDLAGILAAWRSSLANPASWMEKLRGLLALSTEVSPPRQGRAVMDVEQIAKGLTKAQREALLNPEWRGSGANQFALVECLVGLAGPLAHMFSLRWDRLTPLGLAVRAHLLASRGRA